MSHWIGCRLFITILGFSCLVTTTQTTIETDTTATETPTPTLISHLKHGVKNLAEKVQLGAKNVADKDSAQAQSLSNFFGKKNSFDRSFFVLVRLTLVINGKFCYLECGGTLIGQREVLTAASCFMARWDDHSLPTNSDFLQLYAVNVIVDDAYYTEKFEKVKQQALIVKSVDVYRTSEIHQQLSNVRVDIARIVLLQDGFARMSDSPVSNPVPGGAQPLLPCTANDWESMRKSNERRASMKEEDYFLNRVVFTVGWTCSKDDLLESNGIGFPRQVWEEIVLEVTRTEKGCKNAHKMGTRNAQVDGYCTKGRKFLPKNLKYSGIKDLVIATSSWRRICENNGGPVFLNKSADGDAKCLVGVVSGALLAIKNKKPSKFHATKNDWYKGLLFTATENLTSFNLERIYNNPKDWAERTRKMLRKTTTTTTTTSTTTTEPRTEKIQLESKRPTDRSFFVVVRIFYLNNTNSSLSHECAGTLTEQKKVLTAASCFMNTLKVQAADSFDRSNSGFDFEFLPYDALHLTHVEVDVTRPENSLVSPHHSETINAEKVKLLSDFTDHFYRNAPLDMAIVFLEKNAFEYESQPVYQEPVVYQIYRDAPKKGSTQPLFPCKGDLESDLLKERLYMVGWACSPKLIGRGVAMHWQELEINVTAKGKDCKEALGIKSNVRNDLFTKEVETFCAVGINMAPKNESRVTKHSTKQNSDEFICENRGAPVFLTSSSGRDCLAGVVSSTLPKTASGWIDKLVSKFVKAKTKFDWYSGIKFTSIEGTKYCKEDEIYNINYRADQLPKKKKKVSIRNWLSNKKMSFL